MNQKAIVSKIREITKNQVLVKDIDLVVSAFTDVVVNAVSSGQEVFIKNLGKFYPKYFKGKKISKAGIPWLRDKDIIAKPNFKLGFSSNKNANRKVSTLLEITKIKNDN